jgi:hypothetical protein
MLKFLEQTFYQPLFSHFPLAIFFPSAIFSLPNASHTKKPKAKGKSQQQKPQTKAKAKTLMSSFSGPFINSSKQGGAEALGEGRDTVTGETCIPASLNANTLGETAGLLPGLCQSRKSRGDTSRLACVQFS